MYLIIGGWIVTIGAVGLSYLGAARRDARKTRTSEFQLRVDQLTSVIDQLVTKALEYYNTGDGNHESRRVMIHLLIKRMDGHKSFLEKRGSIHLNYEVGNLFEAITDGDFESRDVQPSVDRCKRIVAVSQALLDRLGEIRSNY